MDTEIKNDHAEEEILYKKQQGSTNKSSSKRRVSFNDISVNIQGTPKLYTWR